MTLASGLIIAASSCHPSSSTPPTATTTPTVTPTSTDSSFISVNYPGMSETIKRTSSSSVTVAAGNNGTHTTIMIQGNSTSHRITIDAVKGGNSIVGTYYYPIDSAGYGGTVGGTFFATAASTSYYVEPKRSKVVCTRFDGTYVGGNYDLYTTLGTTVTHVTGDFLIKR